MASTYDEPMAQFPATRWSLVGRAQGGARPALEELLRRYLPALRSYLAVRRGVRGDRVDDLVQGFVTSRLLEHDLVGTADRAKGKFRTLLLTSLDRYVVSQVRAEQAEKRGGNQFQAGERVDDLELAGQAPADVFDVAWAREVLAESLRRMRRECDETGRPDLWGIFEGRIVKPAFGEAEPMDYDELIRRYGCQSPTQAWNVLTTCKRTFMRVLRSVVSEYSGVGDEVELEIHDLQEILSRGGAGQELL